MNYDGWGYPLSPIKGRKKETKDFIERVRNTARNYCDGGIYGIALRGCADRLEKLQEENDTLREALMKLTEDKATEPTEK
jgi:hypothetical protein